VGLRGGAQLARAQPMSHKHEQLLRSSTCASTSAAPAPRRRCTRPRARPSARP